MYIYTFYTITTFTYFHFPSSISLFSQHILHFLFLTRTIRQLLFLFCFKTASTRRYKLFLYTTLNAAIICTISFIITKFFTFES